MGWGERQQPAAYTITREHLEALEHEIEAAHKRETELLAALRPALAEVHEAVMGPSTPVEHDALVRINNVIAAWLFKYHRTEVGA